MDWDEELWKTDEPTLYVHSPASSSKMYPGFNSMQQFGTGKKISAFKAPDEERFSESPDAASPFNQFEGYDKDFFGYNNFFGYGANQEDEGYDETPSQVEAIRSRAIAYTQSLIHDDAISPAVIKKLIDERSAQMQMVLGAAEDDILSLDIDDPVKQKIQGILDLCKNVMGPSETDKKILDSRILAYNANHLKMEMAHEQQRLLASMEDEPRSAKATATLKIKSEARLHRIQKNSARSSNTSECSIDSFNLFGDLDVEAVFKRSTDGQNLWKEMELHRKNSSYKMDHKVEKLFVRILGYTLMDVEKRVSRLISAAERREFMTIVAQSIPLEINLDTFANSTSKGLLDMFIRNKRHYQARKYGISLSSVPKNGRMK